jgi:hypothetical protein
MEKIRHSSSPEYPMAIQRPWSIASNGVYDMILIMVSAVMLHQRVKQGNR